MSAAYIDAIQRNARKVVMAGLAAQYINSLTTTGGADYDCPWPIVRVLSDTHERAMCEVSHDLKVYIGIYEEQANDES